MAMAQAPNGAENFPQRPSTVMSLFSDTGDLGEENMMSFFRTHMETILQPFAQNLEELHKFATGISDHVREVNARSDANTSDLAEQKALVTAMQREYLSQRTDAGDTRTLLDNTIKDLTNLGNVVTPLRAKVDTVDKQVTKSQSEIIEIQKNLEDTRGRVNRCQTAEEKNRGELTRLQDVVDRLTADHVTLDKAHETTILTMNAQKASFEKHVHDNLAVHREYKELRAKFEIFNEHSEGRFKRFDERNSETQKQLLHFRQEAHQANDATIQLLSGRLDAHHDTHEETRDRLNKQDATMADHHAITVENGENFQKLLKMMEQRHENDLRALRDSIGKADDRSSQNSSSIADINKILAAAPPDADGKNRIDLICDDLSFFSKRADRFDKALGLTPLTKENMDINETFAAGILLTESQISVFRETFERFDANHSGTISQQEVGDVIKSLGHECPGHIVEILMKDLDADGSGEINFDEFCILMAKMLGPDGQVHVEGLIQQMSEDASREAKQREIYDLVPQHAQELQNHQKIIDQDHTQLATTGQQVTNLQGQYADLVSEVQKLRRGLQQTQEYWRGLSRGLKETKKTVQQEGEEQMVPSAIRLRTALPALPARPATYPASSSAHLPGNLTAR